MGYESFEGGSHGSHNWLPVGAVSDHDVIEHPAGDGVIRLQGRQRFYIVRACSLCEAVWWQEYDPAEAKGSL